MDTPPATTTYKNHRFPVEIISHAAWLYFRFCLSFRDVEELLLERGVVVTYEAIRKWCRKFGQQYANQLRHRRPRPGDKWQMEVCQTQPINMTWGPLRLLNDTLTHLRGKLKREYVINIHLFFRHYYLTDQAVGDCLAFFKREALQILAQQLPKALGILDDLLPVDDGLLRSCELL